MPWCRATATKHCNALSSGREGVGALTAVGHSLFGVHGIGGLVGTLLTGVFATAAIGGTAGLIEGNPRQILLQLYGIAVTLVWSGGATFILLKVVAFIVPLRLSTQQELEGIDITQHGEALQ